MDISDLLLYHLRITSNVVFYIKYLTELRCSVYSMFNAYKLTINVHVQ